MMILLVIMMVMLLLLPMIMMNINDGFAVGQQAGPPPYWSTTHFLLGFWLKVETSLLVGWLVLVGLDLSLALSVSEAAAQSLSQTPLPL